MFDPGWTVAGCMLAVNIVGWVINRNRLVRDEARREGKVVERLNDLCQRVDRLESRFDEYFSKH